MGRLGLVGFLTAFAGTYLIAVTGNFGFLAPVLANDVGDWGTWALVAAPRTLQ
jgi:hypothetical protein